MAPKLGRSLLQSVLFGILSYFFKIHIFFGFSVQLLLNLFKENKLLSDK